MQSRQPSRTKPAPADPRIQIVRAARQHFFAHGFRSVTMDDLASELGISKKTSYLHFPSKAALLEAVLDSKVSEFESDLSTITADAAGDFTATLGRLLTCCRTHAEELGAAFVRDMRREAPEVFARLEKRRQAAIQKHFGLIFSRGRKLGRVRSDVPPPLITEILVAAMHGIMNPPKLQELKITPKSAFSAIIAVVLDGVFIKGKSKR